MFALASSLRLVESTVAILKGPSMAISRTWMCVFVVALLYALGVFGLSNVFCP